MLCACVRHVGRWAINRVMHASSSRQRKQTNSVVTATQSHEPGFPAQAFRSGVLARTHTHTHARARTHTHTHTRTFDLHTSVFLLACGSNPMSSIRSASSNTKYVTRFKLVTLLSKKSISRPGVAITISGGCRSRSSRFCASLGAPPNTQQFLIRLFRPYFEATI